MTETPFVTVGIKALDEERYIAGAIKSALRAVAPWQGEVVVADSRSSDRTREIAARYPVRLVTLADSSERSCGTGAQLAFQHARGRYFYMLDGDMLLDDTFIAKAIRMLEEDPSLAGVGGRIVEQHLDAADFRIRANQRRQPSSRAGFVDRLDCGGLYRTDAISRVGYFADRNLHAFEEFDLGARLHVAGYRLARIDAHAADHFGHRVAGPLLLLRRLRTGYAGATGEVLRAACGKPRFGFVLRHLRHIRFAAAVLLWWLMMLALLILPFEGGRKALAVAVLLAVPILLLTVRRRSLVLGLHSLLAWNVAGVGLVTGLFRRRVDPHRPIASVIERDLPHSEHVPS